MSGLPDVPGIPDQDEQDEVRRWMAQQYQIIFINGCDTFAYVDDSLRDAHHRVNPEAGPDKYFEMITNAMPSMFHSMAGATMAVVRGLAYRNQTYRQILSSMDLYQRAIVTGEQDNP